MVLFVRDNPRIGSLIPVDPNTGAVHVCRRKAA